MRRGLTIFRRSVLSALLLLGMMALSACSGGGEDEGSTISLLKDGNISSKIVESFEQSYYDKDELQQSILEKVASYNKGVGDFHVTVEKVEVADGVAQVEITYAGPQDYAGFNKVGFFAGTADEAKEAGYDLDVVLSGVKDPQETVGESDILAMEEERILITDVNDEIILNGKALYVSDNVTVSSNAKTVKRTDEGDKMAYVVYR